ncbi:hypothetical protein AgCh_019441 [Apium graveolens]
MELEQSFNGVIEHIRIRGDASPVFEVLRRLWMTVEVKGMVEEGIKMRKGDGRRLWGKLKVLVKALLHYATLLPFLDESIRSEENKVPGCTAQVWLEVKMDFEGFMRFRVDSDSEITKGFASCLIWLLDGATPEEVVGVKAEDLAEMNVGILPANSRVNTWNTVLISMQKRTIALVEQRFGDSAKSLALLNCK